MKVTADEVGAGDEVVVLVEMSGWSAPGGDVHIEWGDATSLDPPILTTTKATAANFTFKQKTKTVLAADVKNKVTVRTSIAKSDDFMIRKR